MSAAARSHSHSHGQELPRLREMLHGDHRLRLRQVLALARIELRRNLFTRRGIWIYLLALAPVGIITLHSIVSAYESNQHPLATDTRIMAGIFQFYYLRLAIFFGCLGIFTWLFRGEVANRSLHYAFLVPMRREVLLLGKFLAGAATAILVFGGAVLLSFLAMYSHFGAAGREFLLQGPGLGHLFAYLGVTALACMGYGALFLALSLVFRNPVFPAILVFFWEGLHAIFPPLMQRLSMTFYLKNLLPVELPGQGLAALFTVVAEPVAAPVAVAGILVLTAAVLALASRLAWRMEVTYSTE
jgi:ABC-type transport system involved in multi-copper enzyme maturation permease subunit